VWNREDEAKMKFRRCAAFFNPKSEIPNPQLTIRLRPSSHDLLHFPLEKVMRASQFVLLLLTAAALSALGQGASAPNPPEGAAALGAVAKAWSLPTDASGAAQIWPEARPEDLAAAALLWKNGGPPPEEGWRLRVSEKSWEGAARKAGVPVDALLKEYQGLLSDQTREALAETGEDWLVLAEIRTLERLTGRGARAIAAELARSDFQTLLLAALPVAGPSLHPTSPQTPPVQAPPNQWQAVDPMAPILGRGSPRNTGDIDGGAPPVSR
jgi:hypothetical protein